MEDEIKHTKRKGLDLSGLNFRISQPRSWTQNHIIVTLDPKLGNLHVTSEPNSKITLDPESFSCHPTLLCGARGAHVSSRGRICRVRGDSGKNPELPLSPKPSTLNPKP